MINYMSNLTPLSWLSTSASNACDPAIHSIPVPLAKKPATVSPKHSENEAVQEMMGGEDSDAGHEERRAVEKKVRFKGEEISPA